MTPARPRTSRHWIALGAFALMATLWVIGCDQNEGQRCQSPSDCASPLVCNLATLTCSNKSSAGQIDATVPIDAPADVAIDAIDAAPDSSVDAMVDAMIDAP